MKAVLGRELFHNFMDKKSRAGAEAPANHINGGLVDAGSLGIQFRKV